MNRRRFLGAIIATCTAPAIVRASSLMPVRAREPWESLFSYDDWFVHEGAIIRPREFGITDVDRTFLPGNEFDPKTYVGRVWMQAGQQYSCLYQGFPRDEAGIAGLDRMAEERMLLLAAEIRAGRYLPVEENPAVRVENRIAV